ncbi:Uncharacterised protein [Vibrio cholerae]|nr:Uncharacterised protein [Vibrio cholerae]
MLFTEGFNLLGFARHHSDRRQLWEPSGEQFFITIAQALWFVHH